MHLGRTSAAAAALVLVQILTLGSVRSQSLEEALDEAYTNNPQLLAERAHLRSTDEDVPIALANWRPVVQLNAGAGYQHISTPVDTLPGDLKLLVSQGDQEALANNLGISISQPIYRGGRTIGQTAQAEAAIASERAHLISVEEAVFFAVVQAYLDCVRDQLLVDLAGENERAMSALLKAIQAQARIGTLTQTDLAQAEAQYNAAVGSRHQVEGALKASRNNFQRAVGRVPAKLSAPNLRPAIPKTRESALELTARNNPGVIAAAFAEQAGAKAIEVVRGQLLPTVSVVGDYNSSSEVLVHGTGKLTTLDRSLMAQLSMPLYEGGAVYAQTRQAEENLGQLKHQTDDARSAAVQAAAQAWDGMEATRTIRNDLSETIKSAQKAFTGMQYEQRVGARSITDVLATGQSLYAYQGNQANAEHDFVLAQFNLAEQLGNLTAANLKLKVPLYDVDRHYQEVREKWFGFGSGKE